MHTYIGLILSVTIALTIWLIARESKKTTEALEKPRHEAKYARVEQFFLNHEHIDSLRECM